MILFVQLLYCRQQSPTRPTPRSPKIQQHVFTPQIRQSQPASVRRLQRKIGSRLPRPYPLADSNLLAHLCRHRTILHFRIQNGKYFLQLFQRHIVPHHPQIQNGRLHRAVFPYKLQLPLAYSFGKAFGQRLRFVLQFIIGFGIRIPQSGHFLLCLGIFLVLRGF